MKLIRALQIIGRWYFTTWGFIFNVFAVATLVGHSSTQNWSLVSGAHLLAHPIQNLKTCSKALRGLKINFRDEIRFTADNQFNQEEALVLLGEQTSQLGKTIQGSLIVTTMVKSSDEETSAPFPVTLEVGANEQILRCLPSPLSAQARLTECLAAAGKPESRGDCVLEIALPSDCEVMGGKLENERTCRVPKSGRILSRKFAALEAN